MSTDISNMINSQTSTYSTVQDSSIEKNGDLTKRGLDVESLLQVKIYDGLVRGS